MDLEENTIQLHRNTIQYLRNVTQKIPDHLKILKSYYAAKFRISQLQTKIRVEANTNKSETQCPRCCLKLIDENSQFNLKPEKRQKLASKLVKKDMKRKVLTSFQREYAKKNVYTPGNTLVITCGFCAKEVKFPCKKPEKVKPKQMKKKVKKKKDKFCGLQKEVVEKVQNKIFTLNNPISSKKQLKKEKRKMNQLSKMFNAEKAKPKNQLLAFLNSIKS